MKFTETACADVAGAKVAVADVAGADVAEMKAFFNYFYFLLFRVLNEKSSVITKLLLTQKQFVNITNKIF